MPGASAESSVRATREFPARLQIGGVTISPATVLAPMAGVTDTVFRRFIKNLGGCGLIMTEFTSADGMLRDQRVRGRYLHFYEDEHPISAQLFGSDPRVLGDAARMVEDLGFDLVDLNLGCPAKKVVKCNGGSGLLRDLPLIRKIFESVRAAVKIPFTVKFRAGWNDDEIICVDLARMAEDCGLGAVALHARTREQGYSGTARWEWIASVKQAVKIPVIGNGDIRSPQDALAMVEQTGCDAVMIGRMAPANPWIFRQIEQHRAWMEKAGVGSAHVGADALVRQAERSSAKLSSGAKAPVKKEPVTAALKRCATRNQTLLVAGSVAGELPLVDSREGHDFSRAESDALSTTASAAAGQAARSSVPSAAVSSPTKPYDEPTEADRYQMIRTYFQMLLEEGMPGAEGKMKQFASWFTHGVPGGAALRKAIYEAKSGEQILCRVEEFFERRLQPSAATNT
jgi:nifR3 family TIM-barrel protein